MSGYSAQGNANATAPVGGFASSGLAQIWGSDFVAPRATLPSSRPEPGVPHRVRRVTIAGAAVGGTVFLALIFAVIWFYRQPLHRMIIGDQSERLEMDGKGRHESELAGNAVFWELPGSGPAELWSPIASPEKEVEQFKFETKSDRDLGWRGEIECEGDATKIEGTGEREDQEDAMSMHTQVACKEVN